MLPITLVVLAGCLQTGLAIGLVTSLKLMAARRPDLPDEPGKGLLSAFNFLLIALLLTASVVLDYFGTRVGFLIGCLTLSLGLALLSLNRPSGRASAQFILAGLGATMLYLATLHLMPRGLLGDQKVVASMLFGFVLMGFGGLLAGPLLEILLHVVGYRLAMLVFGTIALVPLGLALAVESAAFPPIPNYDPIALLGVPNIWFAGLVFAFYAPLESFVTVWITTYLTHQNQQERASGWLGWFWFTFLLSRVLIGIIQHVYSIDDGYQPALLICSALLAAVLLGNLTGSSTTRNALYGVLALGLVLGPVLPTLLATLSRVPQTGNAPTLAFALVHSVGAIGSVVLAPLVHGSAGERTAQQALWVPLILALLMTAASMLYAFTGR
jgi:MFS family permease